VTANTYTHVLVSEAEVDYATLLAAGRRSHDRQRAHARI